MALPRKRQLVFVVHDWRSYYELVRNWVDRTTSSLEGGNPDVVGCRRVRPRYPPPRCVYGFTGGRALRNR